MKKIKPKADFLIEASYEVATLVGGVHRVLESKASAMVDYYGDNYLVIGLYDPLNSKPEFEEKKIGDIELKKIFSELEKEGIKCYYGSWLVEGKPIAILIDISKYWKEFKNIDKEIKKYYGFSVKFNFKYYDSFALWGYATGKLIEKLIQTGRFKQKKVVVHTHDWNSGAVNLYLHKNKCNVMKVVTMHCTSMGRSIALKGEDLYKEIKHNLKKKKIPSDERAKHYVSRFGTSIYNKHRMEKQLVKIADVFTTVSNITGIEAEYILGRKPDIITPNGLGISRFPSLEERSVLHVKSKESIYRFLNAYFLPYYSIDVPNSLLFFTSGRYELKTKGYDLLLDALGKLNDLLKKEGYKNTIFVFLFIMTQPKKINEEILENMTLYSTIEHTVSQEFPHIEKRVISSLVHGDDIKKDSLFDEHFLIESKKLMLKFKSREKENPPICAFNGLKKDNLVIELLLKSGLDNREDDKVKVIFYPAPVSVADGLLSMEYEEVARGMHLGIFPSIYEPWGYTPLETAAHGVMSITTDVAGFGRFIIKNSDQRKKPGIFALKTEGKKREEIIDELVKNMYWVAKLSRKQRIEKKLDAYKLASLADWGNFVQYYIKAHNLAIEKCKKRLKK